GVLLTYSGVLFLCGLPLLRAPTWLLTTLATTTLAVGPALGLFLQQHTSTTFNFVAPSLADPFWTILHAPLLTGAYPVVIWCTPVLLGLILRRLKLSALVVHDQLLGWGVVATILPVASSLVLVAQPGHRTAWAAAQLATGGTSLAYEP